MRTTNGPTYRVYTPAELQSIAPSTFRGAPPPPKRAWYAFGFVIVVGVFISGVSFGALRYFNVDLTHGRGSLGAPDDAPLAAPALPVPAAAPGTPSSSAPAEISGESPKARRKVRGIRRSAAPPAPSAAPVLNLPRAPVVPRASASAGRPAVPAALPANPF